MGNIVTIVWLLPVFISRWSRKKAKLCGGRCYIRVDTELVRCYRFVLHPLSPHGFWSSSHIRCSLQRTCVGDLAARARIDLCLLIVQWCPGRSLVYLSFSGDLCIRLERSLAIAQKLYGGINYCWAVIVLYMHLALASLSDVSITYLAFFSSSWSSHDVI